MLNTNKLRFTVILLVIVIMVSGFSETVLANDVFVEDYEAQMATEVETRIAELRAIHEGTTPSINNAASELTTSFSAYSNNNIPPRYLDDTNEGPIATEDGELLAEYEVEVFTPNPNPIMRNGTWNNCRVEVRGNAQNVWFVFTNLSGTVASGFVELWIYDLWYDWGYGANIIHVNIPPLLLGQSHQTGSYLAPQTLAVEPFALFASVIQSSSLPVTGWGYSARTIDGYAHWVRGGFNNVLDSINYHFSKHGFGYSNNIQSYVDDSLAFWSYVHAYGNTNGVPNLRRTYDGPLSNFSPSIDVYKYTPLFASSGIGGFIVENNSNFVYIGASGRMVSFWYDRY